MNKTRRNRCRICLESGLTPIEAYPGLYTWDLVYDDFIGYMAEALDTLTVKSGVTLMT